MCRVWPEHEYQQCKAQCAARIPIKLTDLYATITCVAKLTMIRVASRSTLGAQSYLFTYTPASAVPPKTRNDVSLPPPKVSVNIGCVKPQGSFVLVAFECIIGASSRNSMLGLASFFCLFFLLFFLHSCQLVCNPTRRETCGKVDVFAADVTAVSLKNIEAQQSAN